MTPPSAASRTPPAACPVAVLLFSATLWGLSWWPLKAFAEAGLSGPVLVLLTYGALGVIGLPWLWREYPRWRAQAAVLGVIALVGGWANAAFVNALVLGDVVRVMLLFYLSPVWSVLGGRLFLGERVSQRRALAVVLALAGAFLVVGGFAALGSPLSVADLLALSAGLGFAANNVASRAGQSIPMASKTVAVFVGCAPMALLLLALQGTADLAGPAPSVGLGLALAAYACIWTVLATATWQYGVTHMEAGRAGVILIAELLVALASAMLIGGETLEAREWLGGALIALAAVLEATDTPAARPPSAIRHQEPA